MTEDPRLIKSAKSARDGNVSEATIPDDIMEVANACFLHGIWDEVTEKPVVTRDLVARAILAERESCAKIAESFLRGGINYDYESGSANGIAAAIRRR